MKTTRISAWVAAGLVVGTALFTACSKSDDTPSLPPIGGYNSSNEVAATNLLAHWTFDGTNNERISGTAPTKASNATFTTGASGKGQALQLNSGYVLYPSIAKLNTANGLSSFTVSTWVNTTNNGSKSSEIFSLTSPTATDWGQMINLLVETGQKKASSDTLILKGLLGQYSSGTRVGHDNVNSGGAADAGTKYQVVRKAGSWIHYVMTYDASTSRIVLYANGSKVSNTDYELRADGKLGALVFPVPQQVLIGAFPNVDSGFPTSANQVWQGMFNGSIDELRVYGKTLSSTDIGYLYQLESAGR